MIDRTIAHYRITERLGGGSMGVVYRAEDTRLKRTVALKFLPMEVSGDPGAKDRFLREAQAASRLDHPNICTVHEVGETSEGQLYIVMAFYHGETLKQRIARGPLPIGDALELAWQIARGLTKAHAENVIHRDIKPANVLIAEDGGAACGQADLFRARILDFGLAKVAGESALTRTGSSIGTPLYMSPEQIGGESDARTDVWSLGVVLYEMLTGQRPFGSGSSAATAMYHILHREPPPLAEARPGLPDGLQQIIDRALAKSLHVSGASMGEFDGDLAVAGSAEGSATQPMLAIPTPGPLREAGRTKAQRRWRRAGAAFLAAAAMAVSSLALGTVARRLAPAPLPATPALESPAATAPRKVAVLPFTYRGSPELGYLSLGMVDLLATKLDAAGDLSSVDPRALLGHLATRTGDGVIAPPEAAAISRGFAADLFVLGNVVEVAGQLRFDARLYRADEAAPRTSACGEASRPSPSVPGVCCEAQTAPGGLASASVEGAAVDTFQLIDRLTAQLANAAAGFPASSQPGG